MNKRELLLKQANELIKKAKELELLEQQKVGKLVIDLQAKGELKDEKLLLMLNGILGTGKGGES